MIDLNQKETSALLKAVTRDGSHSGEVYVLYRRPDLKVYISYTKHNVISKTGCNQDEIDTFILKNFENTYEKKLYCFIERNEGQNYKPKLVITSTAKDFEVRNLFSVSDFNFDKTALGNIYEVESQFVLNKSLTINNFVDRFKKKEHLRYRVLFKLKKAHSIKKVEEFFKGLRIESKQLTRFASFIANDLIVIEEGGEQFLFEGIFSYSIEPRPGVRITLIKSKDYKLNGVVEIVLDQPQSIQGALNDFFEILGQNEVTVKANKPNIGTNEFQGLKTVDSFLMSQPYDFLFDFLKKPNFLNSFMHEQYYYLLNGLVSPSTYTSKEDKFFNSFRNSCYFVTQAKNVYLEVFNLANEIKNKKEKSVFYVFNNKFLSSNYTEKGFAHDEFIVKSFVDLEFLQYVCVVYFDEESIEQLSVPNVTLLIDKENNKVKKIIENLNLDSNIRKINESDRIASPTKLILDMAQPKKNINNDSGIADYIMAKKDNILSD